MLGSQQITAIGRSVIARGMSTVQTTAKINTPQQLERHYTMTPDPIGGVSKTTFHSQKSLTFSGRQAPYNTVSLHSLRSNETSKWFKSEGDITLTYTDGASALHVQLFSEDTHTIQHKILRDDTAKTNKPARTFPEIQLEIDSREIDRNIVVPKNTWVRFHSEGPADQTAFFMMNQSPSVGLSILENGDFKAQFPASQRPQAFTLNGAPYRFGEGGYKETIPQSQRELSESYNALTHEEGGEFAPYGKSTAQTHYTTHFDQTLTLNAVNHILYSPPILNHKLHTSEEGNETWTINHGRVRMTLLLENEDKTIRFETITLGKDLSQGDVHTFTVPEGVYFFVEKLVSNSEACLTSLSSTPEFLPSTFSKGIEKDFINKLTPEQMTIVRPHLYTDTARKTPPESFAHVMKDEESGPKTDQILKQLLTISDSAADSEERLSIYQNIFTQNKAFTSQCEGRLILLPSDPGLERLVYINANTIHSTYHGFTPNSGIVETFKYVDGNPLKIHLLRLHGSYEALILDRKGDAITINPGDIFASECLPIPGSTSRPWTLTYETITPAFDVSQFKGIESKNEFITLWPEFEANINEFTE